MLQLIDLAGIEYGNINIDNVKVSTCEKDNQFDCKVSAIIQDPRQGTLQIQFQSIDEEGIMDVIQIQNETETKYKYVFHYKILKKYFVWLLRSNICSVQEKTPYKQGLIISQFFNQILKSGREI